MVFFPEIHRNASILEYWGCCNLGFIWLSKEECALQLFSLIKETQKIIDLGRDIF